MTYEEYKKQKNNGVLQEKQSDDELTPYQRYRKEKGLSIYPVTSQPEKDQPPALSAMSAPAKTKPPDFPLVQAFGTFLDNRDRDSAMHFAKVLQEQTNKYLKVPEVKDYSQEEIDRITESVMSTASGSNLSYKGYQTLRDCVPILAETYMPTQGHSVLKEIQILSTMEDGKEKEKRKASVLDRVKTVLSDYEYDTTYRPLDDGYQLFDGTKTAIEGLYQLSQAELDSLNEHDIYSYLTGETRDADFWDITLNAATKGYNNAIYGEESFKAMNGEANAKDAYGNILQGNAYNYAPSNGFESAVSGAFEMLGQNFRQWTDPETLVIAGSAAGAAAIGGQLGPQVLAPEEIVTVPSAFLAGMAAGNAGSALEIEAGLAYNEMLRAGISEETARNVALTVGTVNAGLEVLQVDELLDAYKATKASGATKTFTKKIFDELLDRGIDVAKETGQEVAQEGVTMLGVEAGSQIDKGESAYTWGEVGNRLWDTAKSSALSFGLMNVPAAVKNSVSIIQDQKTANTVNAQQQLESSSQSNANTQTGNGQVAQEVTAEPKPGTLEWVQEAIDLGAGKKAQKNAGSKETTVTVSGAGSAINDSSIQNNTLGYKLASNLDSIRDMQPVKDLTGKEFNNREVKLSDQIASFFKSLGNKVMRVGFGDVELVEYGVGGMMNHRPLNRAKMVSLAAVPDVIQNGRQISYEKNWKGRGYDSYIFAAPVMVNGTKVYVAAVVDKRPNNKFYLSEMVDSQGNYVRIEESPSSNSKNGVTDGAGNSGKAGVTARPEGLPEGGNPSTMNAEPTPLFNNIISQTKPGVNTNSDQAAQPGIYEQYRQQAKESRNEPGKNANESVGAAPANPSVGAADRNFTGRAAYQDLLSDENSQRDRPGDVRPVEVPKVDGYGRNVSEFVGNAYGSAVVPDNFTATIEELVDIGALGNDPKTDKETLHEAAEIIKKKGMASARNAITKNIANGKIGDTDIATAMLLFNQYAHKNGQQAQDSAAELFVDLEMMANQSGRNLRLFGLFRKLTPQGQLMAVTKNVDRYVQNINKRRGRKNQVEVSVPTELTNEYIEAAQDAAVNDTPENQQRKLDAEQAIYEYAAANIPATLQEKWDAWRYLAMLGNPKTQIRNIMGNGLFRPFVEAKRYLGAAIESVFLEQDQRTKSVLTFSENDRALLDWARKDSRTADTMQQMEYTATTGDAAVSEIGDRRQIFKTTALEKARTGLNSIMSAEDMWFKRGAYSTALASFLKARGVTSQQLQDGSVDSAVLNAARNYAVKEAMKATFNDQNAVSNFVANKLRYKGNNKFGKILNAAAEGILPFRRTPANIALRGLEYSPLGLGKTLLADTGKLRNGEISAAEYIDNIAAGLTGSAAMALGYALASGIFEGIRLVGNEDDEDEKRTGHKSYALEVGNVSIPVDWAAPAVLPLFMGANLYDSLNPESENVSTSVLTGILDAGANTLEPMLELSCLSSLNDLITDARYAEQGRELYTIAASAATSYFMQGLPTLFGQIEQAFETEKKSIYADSSDPVISEAQQILGRATQKIPGIDFYQTEKVDAWGQTEEKSTVERIFDAFINPANDSRIVETKADSEIKRLNRVQDKNVSPDTPPKTLTFTSADGKVYTDRRLTGVEYEELAKLQGQTQKQIVEDLLANSYYEQLADEDKAKAIRYAYDYARDLARGEVVEEHPGITTKWMQSIGDDPAEGIIRHIAADDNYTSLSVSDASYVDKLLADLLPEKGKANVRTIQQVEAIAGSKLSERDQKAVLEDTLDDNAYAKYLEVLELGMDTDDYAETYRIYLDEKDVGGKGTKARIIEEFQDELDVSYDVAKQLYEIYCPPSK